MTRRMLIVDDEETIRWALRELFMQDGWAVHGAADGDEAAEKLSEQSYDFLITDLKMPGVSGVEVVRRAREANPEIGVLILTGYASLESAIEALRLGAWDYVTKPCKVAYLKERIDEFTSRGDAQRKESAAGRVEPARFVEGAGTELLSCADLSTGAALESALADLQGAVLDLGFAEEEGAQLVQSCVDALGLIPDHEGVKLRAGLLGGCLVVAFGLPGGAPDEVLARLAGDCAVQARLHEREGESHLVLSKAI